MSAALTPRILVLSETGDGATLAGRPELRTLLDFIHPGEMLVVTRIDRLARSMRDLQIIAATLKDNGAHLAATERPVDTSTAAGKVFFDMLGVFAEFETNLRRERRAEGIAAAKQRGTYRDPRLHRLLAGTRDLTHCRRARLPVRPRAHRPCQPNRMEERHPTSTPSTYALM